MQDISIRFPLCSSFECVFGDHRISLGESVDIVFDTEIDCIEYCSGITMVISVPGTVGTIFLEFVKTSSFGIAVRTTIVVTVPDTDVTESLLIGCYDRGVARSRNRFGNWHLLSTRVPSRCTR